MGFNLETGQTIATIKPISPPENWVRIKESTRLIPILRYTEARKGRRAMDD